MPPCRTLQGMSDLPPVPPTHPANWYPDPMGRHEYRYWNGTVWTEHVSNQGVQTTDPVQGSRLDRFDDLLTIGNEGARVAEQVSGTGWRGAGIEQTAFGGGGTLFTEPVLVVNQKAKLIELRNQYSVFDKDGQRIASVNEVGQGALRKLVRLFTKWDQFLTHRLEITDPQNRVIMRLVRPSKVFKSRVVVSGPDGAELGQHGLGFGITKARTSRRILGVALGDQGVTRLCAPRPQVHTYVIRVKTQAYNRISDRLEELAVQ